MLRRRLLYVTAVVLLLGQMAFAMVTTAMQQSPTIDEPVYVGTAQYYLSQHQVLYNPEHPPLAKLIMAAGMAFTDASWDQGYRGNQTALGRHVLYESGNNPYELLLAARIPMIVLTLLFGLAVLFFARDLAGRWAGLIALSLYAFSPDLIAHGSLATLDVPAAGFVLVTFWMLWRARYSPRLYLPLAGVALGAALATRMSTLPAVPIALLLALLAPSVLRRTATPAVPTPAVPTPAVPAPAAPAPAAPAPAAPVSAVAAPATPDPAPASPRSAAGRFAAALRSRSLWRELGMRVLGAISVGVIAVAVVWIVYLIVDPRLRWTTPSWLNNPGGLKGLAVDLLPLPPAYRDGVLIQFRFEQRTFNGFLLGEAYKGGLWYYLPTALLIKTPIGMLLLWLAGTITLLLKKWVAALYLLVPAAVLMLVAMTGARDYGTRYIIFMPMMLAVVASTVVLLRWRWSWVPAAALAAWVGVSSILTFPYYLPYSNEAFGGTSNTHNNLHDSNVDWGQDLPRLATRLRTAYPGEQIWLVYKGAGVPAYYGIDAQNPLTVPIDQVHGIIVVSDSRVALAQNRLKQLIDSSTPIDEVGYSMTIYRR
ncbi:glycosyltransferase family 39 protein [Actinoplanes bogorensis]|uniref:Glycosyltransferase family 39 protein n=1 Tax=Paractinoplanes bogorensis TaxID=1610840 RepID=A0ABS5YG45_9ACTN|nr:glycosyltransferase family 39 protein [Actinoplanes bogorensis]MBU2662459.1 glycosyltransferase family 39 protein [Actinoplanes bogorensis]